MSNNLKGTVIKGVSIAGIAAQGKCIARYNDMVIFVDKVAPGDVANLKIIRKKKNFLEAIPIEITAYSKERSEPFCQHFGTCGGCKWQHIQYATQLHYKQKEVLDNLQRIGKISTDCALPILGSAQTSQYRNKLEYTFSNRRWLTSEEISSKKQVDKNGAGFHLPGRFDKVLDIEKCHLQIDVSNEIRNFIKAFASENNLSYYDLNEHTGFIRNLIIRTTDTSEIMAIVQFGEPDQDAIEKLLSAIQIQFPQITSLQYVVNQKRNETIYDQEVVLFAGQPYLTEKMASLQFRIGPKSFFQTNTQQALKLYQVTKEFAGLTGAETVYDLYTGTGTIANFVASGAKKVVGIESVPEAIDDAQINARINHITNISFFSGDIKALLDSAFIEENGQPDVIITDPPRIGMHADVVSVLLKSGAKKIIYVSCNAATQARDVALLNEKYEVTRIQPVDMFPQTYHVENVILMELR